MPASMPPPTANGRPVTGDPAIAPSVLDAGDIGRVLSRIAHEILEKTTGGGDVVLLGIPTRGVALAHRIAKAIGIRVER